MKQSAKFQVTSELVQKVLSTVDAGLSSGLGYSEPGHMCVEAAVCYAMGLPHGDDPPCVHPVIRELKILLNDSFWSSKTARAKGMRRLAVLQLGTRNCGFNEQKFSKALIIFTVKKILPVALTAIGLKREAMSCAAVTTLQKARDAAFRAANAARDAAYVADAASEARHAAFRAANAAFRAANAARTASSAAYVARDAAHIVKKDEVLLIFAKGIEDILISMKVPAVEFLKLTD